MQHTLFVGTYARADLLGGDKGPTGRAEGLYRLALDEETGTLTHLRTYQDILNASYLALSPDGRLLFCAHELDAAGGTRGGKAAAYRVEEGGGLTPIGKRSTHGGSPCHVAVRPDGRLVCVANYTGGSLSAFAVRSGGQLSEAQVLRHTGRGPHPLRQDAPHVHSACFTPSGRYVTALDLGADTLTTYEALPAALCGEAVHVLHTAPGDGPRMALHDAARALLYAIGELSCNVTAYACDGRGIAQRPVHTASTLPDGAPAPGDTGADLRLSADGLRLYATTRGRDSVSAFDVAEDGALSLAQTVPCGGRTPRAFTLSPSGRWLLCGHQDSDTIAVFAVSPQDGRLRAHSLFALPSPVCLLFG